MGKTAQAETATVCASANVARRCAKAWRVRASRKIVRRSGPQAMTCWRTLGASRRGPRGDEESHRYDRPNASYTTGSSPANAANAASSPGAGKGSTSTTIDLYRF